MAIYDEPFWRGAGLSGQLTSDRGPVKVVFDNSPPDGRPGVLLGFLEGSQARELGRWSESERRQSVLECFTRFFGPDAAKPNEYVEKVWADDEWTRGCYGAFFPPNTWTAFGDALRSPIGPIHWAGAETARVGWATWTALSAPANGLLQRCFTNWRLISAGIRGALGPEYRALAPVPHFG